MSYELTPLQGAELAVRQAENQEDYVALALNTARVLAESNAVQAVALAKVATEAPAKGGGAGKVLAYTGAGCAVALVVVAVFMSLAITSVALACASPVLLRVYREMKGGKA